MRLSYPDYLLKTIYYICIQSLTKALFPSLTDHRLRNLTAADVYFFNYKDSTVMRKGLKGHHLPHGDISSATSHSRRLCRASDRCRTPMDGDGWDPHEDSCYQNPTSLSRLLGVHWCFCGKKRGLFVRNQETELGISYKDIQTFKEIQKIMCHKSHSITTTTKTFMYRKWLSWISI